jgi:hypothetical protein
MSFTCEITGSWWDDVKERAEAVDVVELACQGRGQIEAEPVDVHLKDPVAEAVHDELQRPRMGHVQGIAGAGVVHVVPTIAGHQAVVAGIVDASEGEGRPELVAFAGVVVDHVEDHLDAGLVQPFDHDLEFVDLFAERPTAGVADIGREEADRVVAPVVRQALVDQVLVCYETVDRQ